VKPAAADLRMLLAALPAPARVLEPSLAAAWKLQWHLAASPSEVPERARPSQSRPAEDRKELESCGAPLAPGAPSRPFPQPLAQHPATAEAPQPIVQRHEREPERTPVRLHLQPGPAEGLQVWLGIDGDASLVAQRASAVVTDLRRHLHAGGERIAAVVCNGVAVYPRAASSSPPLLRKDPP